MSNPYTNIPNDEGIEGNKDYISKLEVNKMKPVTKAFLRLILKNFRSTILVICKSAV